MHKTLVSPSQTKPNKKKGDGHEVHPDLRGQRQLATAGEGSVSFPWELYYSLIESYISNNIWEAQVGLDGYYKKKEED